MKKVMLIDPGKISESWYTVREMPNLALGYIGTYLKTRGHEVKIIDMATYKFNNKRLKKEVAEYAPDIVGVTSSTFNVASAFQAASVIKEVSAEIFVVHGGAHASALPELTLEQCPSIDAVVVGEGELAMGRLCETPEKGIIQEDPIGDLDRLPMVDWDLYDRKKYPKLYSMRFNKEYHKYALSIVRGCSFHCKFCFKVLPDPPRSRSADNVFAEILRDYEKYRARLFYVADSTLLIYKDNIHRLCQLIIDSDIEIALIVQSRADTIDHESVKLLKLAGCETFFIGVESGNNDILKRCGKNTNKDMIRNAVKTVVATGIPRIRCSFIIGLEGDTRETINETIEFSKELKSYGVNRASLHCLDIYPGTPYWHMVARGEGNLNLRSDLHDFSVFSRLYPMTSCGDIPVEELKALRDKAREPFQEEY